jgi:hypothetical protein
MRSKRDRAFKRALVALAPGRLCRESAGQASNGLAVAASPSTTSAPRSSAPTGGKPRGAGNRRAPVIARDDSDGKATVTNLLDQFGVDAMDAGPGRVSGGRPVEAGRGVRPRG